MEGLDTYPVRGEARITIAAPAEKVWALVTDISRMGEWSPETYRTEWRDGAAGPAVGARFRGWNRHGPLRWWTTPRVTALEPGRVFEFDTGTTRWRYEFSDAGEGSCEVVESFETHGLPGFDVVLKVLRRREGLEAGARQTLERIKAVAERA